MIPYQWNTTGFENRVPAFIGAILPSHVSAKCNAHPRLKAEGLNSTKESTTYNGASLQQASCNGQNPTLLVVSTEAGSISTKNCNTFNDARLLHARYKGKFPSLVVVLTAVGCLSTKTCTTAANEAWAVHVRCKGQFPSLVAVSTAVGCLSTKICTTAKPGPCTQDARVSFHQH
jgi:hypothetical protein